MLHNEKLHVVYRSHRIVRIAKSFRLRLDAHVVRAEGTSNTFTKTSAWKTKNEIEVLIHAPV
jgi:hypothetical protein